MHAAGTSGAVKQQLTASSPGTSPDRASDAPLTRRHRVAAPAAAAAAVAAVAPAIAPRALVLKTLPHLTAAEASRSDGCAEERCSSCGSLRRGEHKCTSSSSSRAVRLHHSNDAASSFISHQIEAQLILTASVAIERAPDTAQNWLERAQLYRRVCLWRHACSDYSEAIRLQPDNARHWFMVIRVMLTRMAGRGLCWHEAGEFELALIDFRRSHSMRPSAAACNASGHACRALRLLPQAIAEYQRAIALEPHMEHYSNNLASVQRDQQRWLAAAAESACGVLAELSQKDSSADCPKRSVHAKANDSPSSASDDLHLLSGLVASFMDGEGRAAVEQARMQQSQTDAADHRSARLCQRRLQQLEARSTLLDPHGPSAAATVDAALSAVDADLQAADTALRGRLDAVEQLTPPDGASRKRKWSQSAAGRAGGRPLFSDSHELSIFVGGRNDSGCVHNKKNHLVHPSDGLQRVRISWDGSLMHSLQARCTAPLPPCSRLLIQPQSPPPRLASP